MPTKYRTGASLPMSCGSCFIATTALSAKSRYSVAFATASPIRESSTPGTCKPPMSATALRSRDTRSPICCAFSATPTAAFASMVPGSGVNSPESATFKISAPPFSSSECTSATTFDPAETACGAHVTPGTTRSICTPGLNLANFSNVFDHAMSPAKSCASTSVRLLSRMVSAAERNFHTPAPTHIAPNTSSPHQIANAYRTFFFKMPHAHSPLLE